MQHFAYVLYVGFDAKRNLCNKQNVLFYGTPVPLKFHFKIFPSSYLSALYLSRDPNRQSVYCFGSEAMRKEMDKFEIDYFGFEDENELNEINIDRWNQFKVRKNVSHVLCGFDPHFNLTKGKNHNYSFNFSLFFYQKYSLKVN